MYSINLFLFKKQNCFLVLILILNFTSLGQVAKKPDASYNENRWVDSVYNALTPMQRIGQLFMLRANSTGDTAEIHALSKQIKEYNIGGLCFFKGGPLRQLNLTNYYQSIAATPLFIAMDAEYGLGMRLDSTLTFARQMTLGALKNENLIYTYGRVVASQLKRMGVHINFAPVADINSNASNPVINIRSFGENKEDVARKSLIYNSALRKGGILTVAKHFPGHGDTDTDSHQALPVINHSVSTIDTLDLYPFRKLISAGVDGMMVAHVSIPALENVPNLPSSLSPIIVTEILRKRLQFNGLIFTDALDMKGVTSNEKPGMTELKALQAGNDVLLLSVSLEKAVTEIQTAIDSGIYAASDLEMHCKKILSYKYKVGLNHRSELNGFDLYRDLHKIDAEQLNLETYELAITLLKNVRNIIPIQATDSLRIASVTIGYDRLLDYQSRMDNYADIKHFTLPQTPDKRAVAELLKNLEAYNLIIVGVNNTVFSPARNFAISDGAIRLVDTLLLSHNCILNLFALPYSVNLFRNIHSALGLVVAYQDNPDVYNAVAQMLFGATKAQGHLPVTINSSFPVYSGLSTEVSGRLRYNPFESTGILADDLVKVDSIVVEGIDKKAYPGCQVLIAKNGNVIYNKSFSYSDYINNQPVKNSDIYDLASITKVAATTLAVMKLYDKRKIDLDDPLAHTLKYLNQSNKKNITIREVMTHQAGLIPWIPFYKRTLINGGTDTNLYKKYSSTNFPTRVAEGMYLKKDYLSIILDSITASPLLEKKEYVYSDLGFILMQQYVEKITGKPLDQFVEKQFYKPLGLSTMTFKPREKFPVFRLMPTENDTLFRHQVVQGDVHDQASALMGGVAGHAGLFGTANDLAVIFQMLLQKGYYGGHQFIDSSTVDLFTSRQYTGNRRGLGFDKPQLNPKAPGPACEDASPESFGHTGFTGTYVWADPTNNLLIVFLSNRVNPDAEMNRLVQLGTRTRIQQVLYDALKKNQVFKQQNNN